MQLTSFKKRTHVPVLNKDLDDDLEGVEEAPRIHQTFPPLNLFAFLICIIFLSGTLFGFYFGRESSVDSSKQQSEDIILFQNLTFTRTKLENLILQLQLYNRQTRKASRGIIPTSGSEETVMGGGTNILSAEELKSIIDTAATVTENLEKFLTDPPVSIESSSSKAPSLEPSNSRPAERPSKSPTVEIKSEAPSLAPAARELSMEENSDVIHKVPESEKTEKSDNPNLGKSPVGESYVFYEGPKHQEGQFAAIPKVIYQTYKDARLIPDYVQENFEKFAPGWKREIWDDRMVDEYFQQKGDNMSATYNSMHYNAHKADFWRYNILYDRGGLYMDIKCSLIQPLDELLTLNNTLYTVIANNGVDIFNGIVASPPKNPVIWDQIQTMIDNPNEGYYRWYIMQFGKRCRELLEYSEKQELIHTGYWENREDPNWNFYFWREHCTKKAENCYDGLDRYGQCCFAFDGDTPEPTDIQYYSEEGHAWKIRYAEYPNKGKWKEKSDQFGRG